MTPKQMEETVEAERITGASRVGLWKMLAASLAIVIIGIAIIAGLMAQ